MGVMAWKKDTNKILIKRYLKISGFVDIHMDCLTYTVSDHVVFPTE